MNYKPETNNNENILFKELNVCIIKLINLTKRNLLLYVSSMDKIGKDYKDDTKIVEKDLPRVNELTKNMNGSLDIILESPGGDIETAIKIGNYLRSKFNDIRIIIPRFAGSSATMLTFIGNKILMAKDSFLSPTDPQFEIKNGSIKSISAQRILDENITLDYKNTTLDDEDLSIYDEIKKSKKNMMAILLMINHGSDYEIKCENILKITKYTLSHWLENIMFANKSNSKGEANKITEHLTNYKNFPSHNYFIYRDQVKELGLIIKDLEDDQELHDDVFSILDVIDIIFLTDILKIIINQEGIKIVVRDKK